MGIFIGNDSDLAKQVVDAYIGVNGQAKKVDMGYFGNSNSTAEKIFECSLIRLRFSVKCQVEGRTKTVPQSQCRYKITQLKTEFLSGSKKYYNALPIDTSKIYVSCDMIVKGKDGGSWDSNYSTRSRAIGLYKLDDASPSKDFSESDWDTYSGGITSSAKATIKIYLGYRSSSSIFNTLTDLNQMLSSSKTTTWSGTSDTTFTKSTLSATVEKVWTPTEFIALFPHATS